MTDNDQQQQQQTTQPEKPAEKPVEKPREIPVVPIRRREQLNEGVESSSIRNTEPEQGEV